MDDDLQSIGPWPITTNDDPFKEYRSKWRNNARSQTRAQDRQKQGAHALLETRVDEWHQN